MSTKNKNHPLRAKIEKVAFVWHIILLVSGAALAYCFQNWLILVGGVLAAMFLNGYFALIWLRLMLGKEGYDFMVMMLALEDNQEVVAFEDISSGTP